MVGLTSLNVSGTRYNDRAALAILPNIGGQLLQFECASTKITDHSGMILAALTNATKLSVCFSEHMQVMKRNQPHYPTTPPVLSCCEEDPPMDAPPPLPFIC